MAKEFTLGKSERLKSRKAIELLFTNGQRLAVSPFRVFYSFEKNGPAPNYSLQAGFAASSRIFKTAVLRNKIKRLTKEAWRLQKNELRSQLKEKQQKLNVFFIYTGKESPAYDVIAESIKVILSKLIVLSNKKN